MRHAGPGGARRGVRSQPIPIISLLLVSSFLLTSVVGYLASVATNRTGIVQNELPLTSDNIYSELQRDLLQPILISSVMATDTFLRDWILDGETQVETISKYLADIKDRYGAYSAFLVSELSWSYYYPAGVLKQVSPGEPRDQWYWRVREMEEDYEINVDPDMANQDAMTIFINYRVSDYAGNFIGATGVGLTVRAVQTIVEKYHSKYDRRIYFINQQGGVELASAGVTAEFQNVFDTDPGNAFVEALRNQSEASFEFDRDGTAILANLRFIPELNWHLVVEQEIRPPGGRIRSSLLLNLGIGLVIAIVVIVLVSLTVKSYSQSLDTLRGIVPICSYCKQVRDDKGYWSRVEAYVSSHSEAKFSHGICPDCKAKYFPDLDTDDST